MISAPLRSRFTMTSRLDYYNAETLQKIVLRSAEILGTNVAPDGALEIARRSRGTPRIVNNLLKWVRDYAQVKKYDEIDKDVADKALNMLDIDMNGLDEMDARILETILVKFKGGPVGVKTIAIAVGESIETIEDVYEPYLIQEGYIMRTAQGRVATDKAAQIFGINIIEMAGKQGSLF